MLRDQIKTSAQSLMQIASSAQVDRLQSHIRQLGLAPTKAKNISAMSKVRSQQSTLPCSPFPRWPTGTSSLGRINRLVACWPWQI